MIEKDKDEWQMSWLFFFYSWEALFKHELECPQPKMKEDEEASSFKLTTNRGHQYRAFVVASVLNFFGSSFPLQAWWLRGIYEESTYTQLGSKQVQKDPRTYKTQVKNIPKRKKGIGV